MSAPPLTGYPRDLVGYGPEPPDAAWPGGARLALNLVLIYEEGASARSSTAMSSPRRSCPR
jgi:hypothetical protein